MRVYWCLCFGERCGRDDEQKKYAAALCGSKAAAAAREAANLESAPKSGRFIATVVIECIGKDW
jgi:hypothetical protein